MEIPFYLDRKRSTEPTINISRAGWSNRGQELLDNAIGEQVHKQNMFNTFARENFYKIQNSRPAPAKLPTDWTTEINYNDGYQSDVEQRFRNEHRYLELADYLSHFRMDTPLEQRDYDNEISQIRRYGRQYNAIHSKASDAQEHSISFLEAYNNGSIDDLDDKNPLKEQYFNAITSLGKDIKTTDGFGAQLETPIIGEDEASTISVTFNNKHVSYGFWGLPIIGADWMSKDVDENQFNKFSKDTGYGLTDIQNILGEGAVSNKDGRLTISIPKSNLQGVKLLTEIRKWCNDTERSTDDVSYASYDTKNDLISDNTVNIGNQIQGLSNFLDQRNKDKDDVMTSIGGEQQITSTTILPYMNERQMQLMQLRDAGVLDDSKYSAMLKADNEVYENLLLGTGFSQLEVFTDRYNDDGSENLYALDNQQRGELKSYIRNAIRENRVSWRAGISGGKYGTYLVVTPEDDKGDLITDADDARSGATIFIPGLFTKSIQNAFNASTQGKTVAEINSMQQYGYEYTFQNGNVLSNVGNFGARLYNKDTDSYTDITREQAHALLHQDIIAQDATANIRNRMFNLDGSVRQGYDYDSAAKAIALAGANEIYPNNPIDAGDVWPVSPSDMAARRAAGNLDKDYKSERCAEIYNQIMGNIYSLLNLK